MNETQNSSHPPDNQKKIDRLETLKLRKSQLEEQIKRLEAQEAGKKRKEDTRLKVLVGAAMLADLDKLAETDAGAVGKRKEEIRAVLNRAIQRKQDRDFLQAAGWL